MNIDHRDAQRPGRRSTDRPPSAAASDLLTHVAAVLASAGHPLLAVQVGNLGAELAVAL